MAALNAGVHFSHELPRVLPCISSRQRTHRLTWQNGHVLAHFSLQTSRPHLGQKSKCSSSSGSWCPQIGQDCLIGGVATQTKSVSIDRPPFTAQGLPLNSRNSAPGVQGAGLDYTIGISGLNVKERTSGTYFLSLLFLYASIIGFIESYSLISFSNFSLSNIRKYISSSVSPVHFNLTYSLTIL